LAAKATEAEKTELTAAEDALNKAIQLKPDYAPAHYYLAAVYERQGKLQEAADRLTALTRYSPNDIGLGFQLAMLDIRLENLDAARAELERIVGLNPDYSNALWYLSAVEEVQGDDVQALQNAQHVLELNPTNEAAKARVNALQSGNSTPQELPSPVEEGEGDVVGE
jgi:tetratricopeptide (TPR) repeat protein